MPSLGIINCWYFLAVHFLYPQNGKNGPFLPFWGYKKWHFGCPNQNSETTFRDPNHPQNPHFETLRSFFGPRKVIFGHFVNFAYFYLVLPLARAFFFKCKRTTEGVLKSKSWWKQTSLELDRKFNFKASLFSSTFWFEHSFRCPFAFEENGPC